jgi:hypothetical protein
MNDLLWVSSIPLAYLLYRGIKVTYNDVKAYYKNKESDNLSDEKFDKKVKLIGEYQWMVAASSADVRCTAVQRVTKARKQKVHDAMRAQVPVAVYPMVKR